MSIDELKLMSKKEVGSVLKNVHNICCYCKSLNDEYRLRLERTRLNIAYRLLHTDSLERKICAMGEYKDFIDSTKRKYEEMIELENDHESPPQSPVSRTFSTVPNSMQIYYIDCENVLKHLIDKNILQCLLRDGVEKEIIGQSYDIIQFLAQNGCLMKQHIDLLWQHVTKHHKSLNVCS